MAANRQTNRQAPQAPKRENSGQNADIEP